MTLYRHFKDKEQILLYSFELYLEQTIREMSDIIHPSLVDLLKLRFKILKESSEVHLIIKSGQFDKLFQTIGKNYSSHFQRFFPVLKNDYLKEFVAGGVDAITKKWFEGGMKESYDEMANRVTNYISILATSDLI
jgi:AcrR family transcriptional regulator